MLDVGGHYGDVSWTAGSGVTEYWLQIGSTPGTAELYNRSLGTSLSGT